MTDDAPNRDRAIVFIDGNNLYHRLKERGWRTWINIGSLSKRVVGERELVHIYYYNAPPPGGRSYTKKGNEYLSQVRATPNLTLRQARLQSTQKTDEYGPYQSYVEKGADTALSTDLVVQAASNAFDIAIIISNDGDYEPTVRTIRDAFGKSVEVVYFTGSRPFAMESCALMREFRKSFLREYDRE